MEKETIKETLVSFKTAKLAKKKGFELNCTCCYEIYFRISDANHTMYHPKKFASEEEARETIEKEYTNRNKNDGYDEYWRNRQQTVIKITEEVLG